MISIITISFNQNKFLPRCIESIRSQGFTNYEHVIVDPGSVDGSREFLSGLDDKRIKLCLKPDKGPAEGLNNGISVCTGDVIMYVNADDAMPPGTLRFVDDFHRNHPDDDILIGNGWTIDANDRPIAFIRSDRFTPLRYGLSVGTVLQQASSFKRRLLDRGLKFNVENRVNWDTELLFDIYKLRARFAYVNRSLGYFRIYDGTITTSGSFDEQLKIKRRELLDSSLTPRLLIIVKSLAPYARLFKFAKNRLLNTLRRPEFPEFLELKKESL